VTLREEHFHARDKFGLAELPVLVGIELLQQRFCHEHPGAEAARPEPAWPLALAAGSEPTRPSARSFLLEELACRLALLLVQPSIPVLVDLFHQLTALTRRPPEHEPARTTRAEREPFLVGFLFLRLFFGFRLARYRQGSQQENSQEGQKGQPG